MFCTQCGTKLPDEALFCTNCGSRVSDEARRLFEASAPAASVSASAQVESPIFDAPVVDSPVIDTPSSSVYTPPASTSSSSGAYIPPSATQSAPSYSSTPEPYSSASVADYPPARSYGASIDVKVESVGSKSGEPKMKWYKFIIYFQLFASAVVNGITGFLLLTGLTYRISSDGYVTADMVYAFFRGLHAIDIIFGLLMIALAVWAIFIRFDLAKFEKGAPKKYLIFLVSQIVFSALYLICASIAIGAYAGTTYYWASIVTSIILIVVNYFYFKKRSDMFNKEPRSKYL